MVSRCQDFSSGSGIMIALIHSLYLHILQEAEKAVSPLHSLVLKFPIIQGALGTFSTGKRDLRVPIPLYFQRNVNKAGNVILDMDFKGERKCMLKVTLKALPRSSYFRVP